jgi:hypothetical protein
VRAAASAATPSTSSVGASVGVPAVDRGPASVPCSRDLALRLGPACRSGLPASARAVAIPSGSLRSSLPLRACAGGRASVLFPSPPATSLRAALATVSRRCAPLSQPRAGPLCVSRAGPTMS